MYWWQNALFSPSSSSKPKSSAASPQKRNVRDILFFRKRLGSDVQPRLTRQRKLRHLTDDDIGRLPSRNISPLTHPNSAPVSRSSSTPDPVSASAGTRPSSVVPHPLPRPELYMLLQRDSGSRQSGDCPLPSPKEAPSRRDGEDGDRTDCSFGDGTEEGVPGRSSTSRSSSLYMTRKKLPILESQPYHRARGTKGERFCRW